MKLSIIENNIIITKEEEDSNDQIDLQFNYFGFVNSERIWIYNKNDYIEKLYKIIDYLIKEQIHFSYDENVEQILKQKAKITNEFQLLKQKAQYYKNGIYDSTEFALFIDFINSTIIRNLKQHQIKAAYHHYSLKNAANFSVPGSGKTSVILTVFEKMRQENEVNIIFVVGPTSCFEPWKREFKETLGRIPNYRILSGDNKESRLQSYSDVYNPYELYLTSFQSFCYDIEYIIKFFNHKKINAFLVIDEAHYIKQIGGTWASSLLQVSKFAKARFILTGTPCPQSYSDLFNLFDFLWNDIKPITQTEKYHIQVFEETKEYSKAIDILKETIDPLFYRVRKIDLGLTEPVFETKIVKMKNYERSIYDAVYKKIHELSFFDKDISFNTLVKLKKARIIRLRQLTSYPRLLHTAIDINDEDDYIKTDKNLNELINNYDKYETPGKFDALIELITRIQLKDRKVLIWSNFIENILFLKDKLNRLKYFSEALYGQVPVESDEYNDELTREKIISDFLSFNSDLNILIANPGACAESISLHKGCYHAIYYDLSYNCAQYLQSLDRIHRVGGSETNIAHYYFLQYDDTIDSDIINNLNLKAQKMFGIIERNSDIYDLDIASFDINTEINAYERLFSK